MCPQSGRAQRPGRCGGGWAGAPPIQASVCPVLPLLVLFILLPVAALGAEPLHLFWGRGHDPHAGPVVPVVTVVTADHGAPIIGLVAAGTDPDLVSPLVSDHISADRLRDHTADRGFGAGGSRSSRGWGGHPGEGCAGRGQEGQRHRGRGDVHGGRGGGWGGGRRLGSVQRRCRLSLGGWDHFADDTVNKRETEKSKHTVESSQVATNMMAQSLDSSSSERRLREFRERQSSGCKALAQAASPRSGQGDRLGSRKQAGAPAPFHGQSCPLLCFCINTAFFIEPKPGKN